MNPEIRRIQFPTDPFPLSSRTGGCCCRVTLRASGVICSFGSTKEQCEDQEYKDGDERDASDDCIKSLPRDGFPICNSDKGGKQEANVRNQKGSNKTTRRT